MFRVLKGFFIIATLISLVVFICAPIALLPFGLMAIGFGIGALLMAAATPDNDNTTYVVSPGYPATPTVIVMQQQPTVTVSSWGFNWFPNWFSNGGWLPNWSWGRHYTPHDHSHSSSSLIIHHPSSKPSAAACSPADLRAHQQQQQQHHHATIYHIAQQTSAGHPPHRIKNH